MRFFNTEGPVVARKHYCIPPLERVNADELLALIAQERYFVLHAPRQTGKTSALLALRDLLEGGAAGDYRCVYVNVEAAQAVREDVERAMRVILGEMGNRALFQGDGFLDGIWSDVLARFGDAALGAALTRWCRADPKPLVLLIDEIDTLIGDTLIAVLRQLRAGYDQRPEGFPQSVVLCGVREGARLPHPFEHRAGDRHRRQRVQHPRRVAAHRGLHRPCSSSAARCGGRSSNIAWCSRWVRERTKSEVFELTVRVAHHSEFVTMIRAVACSHLSTTSCCASPDTAAALIPASKCLSSVPNGSPGSPAACNPRASRSPSPSCRAPPAEARWREWNSAPAASATPCSRHEPPSPGRRPGCEIGTWWSRCRQAGLRCPPAGSSRGAGGQMIAGC